MKKQELLEKLKGKLIVSCQARVGWAMYGVDIMAAFAKAAEEGGAAGIRATGVDNITAIKQRVNYRLSVSIRFLMTIMMFILHQPIKVLRIF